MPSLRSYAVLDHEPEVIWPVIRDVAGISKWFPGMLSSSGDDSRRTVTLTDGSVLHEDIVRIDDGLRRLQYRAVGGDLPVTEHLGTVDLFPVCAGQTLVVYSTEIEPAELAPAFHAAIDEAVRGLPAYIEENVVGQ